MGNLGPAKTTLGGYLHKLSPLSLSLSLMSSTNNSICNDHFPSNQQVQTLFSTSAAGASTLPSTLPPASNPGSHSLHQAVCLGITVRGLVRKFLHITIVADSYPPPRPRLPTSRRTNLGRPPRPPNSRVLIAPVRSSLRLGQLDS